MEFIKRNWLQGLTVALSMGVAAGLLTHHLTSVQAVTLGTILGTLGIHLPAVVYKAGDS